MGLYDRGYMREGKPRRLSPEPRPPASAEEISSTVPAWKRLLFRFWLWFRERGPAPAPPTVPRVVLDTNALVAARWKPESASARIMELCRSGRLRLVLSREVDRENRRILEKVRPPDAYWDRLEEMAEKAEWVEPAEEIRASEDPDDDKFLSCAIAGRADCVVSSDQHLLALDGYRDLRICTPGAFLSQEAPEESVE